MFELHDNVLQLYSHLFLLGDVLLLALHKNDSYGLSDIVHLDVLVSEVDLLLLLVTLLVGV